PAAVDEDRTGPVPAAGRRPPATEVGPPETTAPEGAVAASAGTVGAAVMVVEVAPSPSPPPAGTGTADWGGRPPATSVEGERLGAAAAARTATAAARATSPWAGRSEPRAGRRTPRRAAARPSSRRRERRTVNEVRAR